MERVSSIQARPPDAVRAQKPEDLTKLFQEKRAQFLKTEEGKQLQHRQLRERQNAYVSDFKTNHENLPLLSIIVAIVKIYAKIFLSNNNFSPEEGLRHLREQTFNTLYAPYKDFAYDGKELSLEDVDPYFIDAIVQESLKTTESFEQVATGPVLESLTDGHIKFVNQALLQTIKPEEREKYPGFNGTLNLLMNELAKSFIKSPEELKELLEPKDRWPRPLDGLPTNDLHEIYKELSAFANKHDQLFDYQTFASSAETQKKVLFTKEELVKSFSEKPTPGSFFQPLPLLDRVKNNKRDLERIAKKHEEELRGHRYELLGVLGRFKSQLAEIQQNPNRKEKRAQLQDLFERHIAEIETLMRDTPNYVRMDQKFAEYGEQFYQFGQAIQKAITRASDDDTFYRTMQGAAEQVDDTLLRAQEAVQAAGNQAMAEASDAIIRLDHALAQADDAILALGARAATSAQDAGVRALAGAQEMLGRLWGTTEGDK